MSWPAGRSADGGLDHVPLPSTTGSLWLCGKRVVGVDPEEALRRAGGAHTIVSFNERDELLRDYLDYVRWLDANAGDRALWFPIPDLHAPALDYALRIVDELVARLERGDGLVLHCAGGIGRAPTIATCVLITLGMPRDDALAHVAAHRPMAGPEVGAQRDLVDALAETVRRNAPPVI